MDERDRIIQAYQEALGRDPESDAVIDEWLTHPEGVAGAVGAIYRSDEAQAYGAQQSAPPPASTSPSTPPVSPVSTTTDPTSPSPTPRTAANPFGSAAPAATDVGMSTMIERDKASWEVALRARWPPGLAWDPGALDGMIRQLSYAGNAGQDPRVFLDAAINTAKTRAQSGGPIRDASGALTGNYNTNWNDADPARLLGRDPSAAYTTAMTRLQTAQDAERNPAKRAALQAQMAAMFNGAYVGPPPPASTLGAIAPPAASTNVAAASTPPPAQARATATPAAPLAPYSARATAPVTMTPATTAPASPVRTAAVAPYAGTLQNMMGGVPPSSASSAAENAWNATNANYRQAGARYAAQQPEAYNPAPWSGTRLGAPRTAMEAFLDPGAPTDATVNAEIAARRRAYQFGRQNAYTNQTNAALGQSDFTGQMDNWLRAYNDWHQRGVDPLAMPMGSS